MQTWHIIVEVGSYSIDLNWFENENTFCMNYNNSSHRNWEMNIIISYSYYITANGIHSIQLTKQTE